MGDIIKKRRGLRRRWLLSSLAVVVAVLFIVMLAFFIVIADYYYGNIETNLRTRAAAATRSLAVNNMQDYATFSSSIIHYVENFADRGVIEAQFIGQNGRVENTSTGLTVDILPQTNDVLLVLDGEGMSSFHGTDMITGERVISVTAPLNDGNDRLVGALRLVTSLRTADAHIAQNMLETFGAGLIAILIITLVNFLYINSVTKSLREITDTASKIAAGSYGIRVEKNYNGEIGQLAETLNHMSAEICAAEKIKTDFISNVSHELRTPLTAITGWGETLLDANADDSQDVQKGIRIMLKETDRLSRMVEQLLDFTTQESGRMVMTMEPFDLVTELDELLDFYRDAYHAEGIALNYSSNEEHVMVIGDKERLKQVFINLLDNASKHGITNKNKRIDVRLEIGDDVKVIIRDHGKGIAAEDIPHVKLKYYRGASAARGNGIGLAIADEIINAHNGSLEIDSVENEGTEVTLTLPMEV